MYTNETIAEKGLYNEPITQARYTMYHKPVRNKSLFVNKSQTSKDREAYTIRQETEAALLRQRNVNMNTGYNKVVRPTVRPERLMESNIAPSNQTSLFLPIRSLALQRMGKLWGWDGFGEDM